MPEASTSETQSQSGTTAARQMLAALTRTSQEITKRFSESCEYVSKLNSTLENKVNGRLADINESAENIVRVQLENLSAEKDSVLAELTKLRQEELRVLQSIGKDLREALSERLKEMVSGLKSEIDQKLSLYQDGLVQTEAEVSQAVASLREGLNEKLPEHLALIQKEAGEEKKELENTQVRQKDLLNQEASQSLEALALHCDELKKQLEKQGVDYLAAIDTVTEKLVAEQTEKLKQRIQSLSKMQEQARQHLQADIDNVEGLLTSFGASCQQISELRLNLHSSMANNLALIYRTELLSIAQETEDQVVIVRSHLQSVLRSYHSTFSEQSASLLSRFEKAAREARPAQSDNETKPQEEEVPAEVKALLAKLSQEAHDKIKEITSKADTNMEESLADFRARLNESSQNLTSMAENKFNELRKEISETVETNKARLEELSQKANALEQLVDESKELISVFDQSNLEF